MKWTPWRVVILNTILRRLWPSNTYAGLWLWMGKWFTLRDGSRSSSVKVAYEEMQRGWYTPPLPLRPGDRCLDLGAHVGTWSILHAKANPQVSFIALEPDRQNYGNLWRNITANGVRDNVSPVCAGVWSHPCSLISEVRHDNTGGNRSTPGHASGIQVHGYTLKEIRAIWGLDTIRCLKLDAEGAEFQCIQTPEDLEGVESLLIEIHGDMGNTRQLLGVIQASGIPYTAQVINPNGSHAVIRGGHNTLWQSLSRPITVARKPQTTPQPPPTHA